MPPAVAVILAIAIALVLAPTRAGAGEPELDPVAASIRKFDEGRAAFEDRRWEDARAAFEASYKLQASPNSLLYIGRCHREAGRPASAYVALRRSAREAQDRLTATLEKRYAATRDAAAAEAVEIEARVPRLALAVPAKLPSGFVLRVNGRSIAPESWGVAIETDPGPIVVEASGSRMRPFRAELTLREGEARRVEVGVERLPTAMVNLVYVSRPSGLATELDGVPIDPPRAPIELDVGSHRIVARAPGYVPFAWERPLRDGAHEDVRIDLRAERGRHGTAPWLFYATAAGAIGSVAIGTGFALVANGREGDEVAKPPLLRDPDTRDGIQTQATVANVFFVTGAVLAVGAAILYFTTDWGAR